MDKIAVIGLACLFPGAQTPAQFWQNLSEGKDSTFSATAEQMGVDPAIFFDPAQGKAGKTYYLRGGYIQDFTFDPTGYHISSAFLEGLDDLFKWSLYVAKEALRDSGYLASESALSKCGIILGNLSFPTKLSHQVLAPIYHKPIELAVRELLGHEGFQLSKMPSRRCPPGYGVENLPVAAAKDASVYNAMIAGYPAAIISQALALSGASFSLDAACASSLYTVKLACQYLLSHQADLMLAGGVNGADPLVTSLGFSSLQAFPKNGIGRPFNKSSGGLTVGHGAGMLVLKRYGDAIRDGDQIYATICGIGLSNDGRGKHPLTPNPKGQLLAFERAYAAAGIDPASIDYVECHATGTPIGDITELNSMDTFFGQYPRGHTYEAAPLVGAVKSNIGHLLSAAGIAGMIKVILSLSEGLVPPTIHLTDPINSRNGVITAKQMVRAGRPWPEKISPPGSTTLKRAGVSAFGFGGTNAHIILERQEAEDKVKDAERGSAVVPPSGGLGGPAEAEKLEKVAIIGMEAFFGSSHGLDAFERTIYDGTQHFMPIPTRRWQGIEGQHLYPGYPPSAGHTGHRQLRDYGFENGRGPSGAYIEDFEVDAFRLKMPPNEIDKLNPQQLLMLKVADEALRDAGLVEGSNVAVIVAMGIELSFHRLLTKQHLSWQIKKSLEAANIMLPPEKIIELETIVKESLHHAIQPGEYLSMIGNIMASRISALWDFSGPSFTLSAEENSVYKALEVAQMLLAAEEVEAVLVGAVDLAGGVENVLLRNQLAKVNTGESTMSHDQAANGWLVGEGAGAVVLKRYDKAREEKRRIYAVLDAVSIVHPVPQGHLTRGHLRQENLPSDPPNPPKGGTSASTTPTDPFAKVEDALSEMPSGVRGTEAFPRAPAAGAVKRACQGAFDKAGVKSSDIGYLEVFGSGLEWEDEAEHKGLLSAYCPEWAAQSTEPTPPERGTRNLSCAIGSVKANIGHTYAASGMASLIKTALCLYYRYIPATPGWSAPKKPAVWAGSPFYVAPESRPWFLEKGMAKRVAAINGLGLDGAYTHLILSEDVSQTERTGKYLAQTSFYLFPIAADDRSALVEQLNILEQTIKNCASLPNAARQSFETFQNHSLATYAVAIVGHDKEEVIREIQHARKGVSRAFDQGNDWKTPQGSYFTAKPLGRQGAVSFVYPGAFTSYIGLVQDLFHLFPQTYAKAANLAADMGLGIEQYLYPRSLSRLSPPELERIEAQLMADTAAMLKAGTASSWLFTVILRDFFRVRPKSAFGYSLGEFSMLLALDIWREVEKAHADPRALPLFNTRLSGPKNAVRQYWGLPQTTPLTPHTPEGIFERGELLPQDGADEGLWRSYVLLVPAAAAREALKDEDRVYLTHINAPAEVVIAGDRQSCLRVIETLKCDYFRAPFDAVLHCEAIASEYDEFVKLFTLPVQSAPEIDLYSAADYAPITLESQAIAHNIAKALCKQLDFPQLIDQAYKDGARIFIELGPGGTCTRWIGETLNRKPHLAIPINRRGVDDHTSIVKLLAQLLCHRTSVDLSPLYGPAQESVPEKQAIIKTITLGGRRIDATILTEENKQSFKDLVSTNPETHELARVEDAPPGPPGGGVGSAEVPPSGFRVQGSGLKRSGFRVQGSGFLTLNSETLNSELRNSLFEYQKISDNRRRGAWRDSTVTTKAHASFLRARRDSLQQMSQLIQLQMTVAQQLLRHSAEGYGSSVGSDREVIFNEADLLEFAGGKISNVFGSEYGIIDTYSRRVRLPMPPYLFVSRVTKLQAERGRYEPCSIETEYDIPHNAWYTVDGQSPGAVAVEASHANMLLISYLGIDFENQGRRVYRALDCRTTFLADLPKEGETIRCEVKINSFTKTGDTLLFFYSYDCFVVDAERGGVGDKLLLKMNGGAGFFSDEELANTRGIMLSERRNIQKTHFEPLLSCPKSAFDETDLLHLSEGNIAACFGEQYQQDGRNPSLRLPPPAMRMVDRVTSIDPRGGAWGLGLIVGEKILSPEHWYFNCHFKDDFCMPGVLIGEGCAQLLQFYFLFLGLQTWSTDARFQPIPNLTLVGRNRGQIRPTSGVLTYRLEISEIGLSPKPFVKANFDVIFNDAVITRGENLGMQLSEK